MPLQDKIIEFFDDQGVSYKTKNKTFFTDCPECGRDDKFSILKANGSTVCYRGSCTWGVKPFFEYMAVVGNMTVNEAKSKLYQIDMTKEIKFDFKVKEEEKWNPFAESQKTVDFPEKTFSLIGIENEGSGYVRSRGIEPEIADKYGVKYNFKDRRVMFPAIVNGQMVGYQGRAIDKVPDYAKVRNNEDFRRDQTVLFIDHVREREFVIIAEGPFDALKFHLVGNFIATMGKVVTEKQLALINTKSPKRIYLALDDDAAEEMTALAKSFDVPVFLVSVPDSCRDRCRLINKKADFGECTPEEAKYAFDNAQQMGYYSLIVNWEKK